MRSGLRIAIAGVAVFGCAQLGAMEFQRGDANADGTINVADAIFTLSFLYSNSSAPPCLDAADVNDDGEVDIADAIFGLSILAPGPGVPTLPPPPWASCGLDPSADALDCAVFDSCP